jgi:hypothetical protein
MWEDEDERGLFIEDIYKTEDWGPDWGQEENVFDTKKIFSEYIRFSINCIAPHNFAYS